MIKLVTDSTCDIPRAELKAMGVSVLPLTVNFGSRVYRDGVDLGHAEFYELLKKAQKLPTTSQINPGAFQDLFEDLTADGSEVVGIFLSSELSGTAHSAMIAANAVCPERIFVVDSRSVSLGLGLLVHEAVKLRQEGSMTAAQLAKQLQTLALRTRVFAVMETLKYLKMGGRLTGGAAAIGGLLGILPIVQVYDGRVDSIGKVRGEKAAMRALEQQMREHPPELSLGFAFGHAAAQDRMKQYINYLCTHLVGCKYKSGWVGSVIGSHAGPGVVGIAYFEQEKA